jgi:hypothetical protein
MMTSLLLRLRYMVGGFFLLLLSPVLALFMACVTFMDDCIVARWIEDFSGAFAFWVVMFGAVGLGLMVPRYRDACWYRLHSSSGSCSGWEFFWNKPDASLRTEKSSWIEQSWRTDQNLDWACRIERSHLPQVNASPLIGLVFFGSLVIAAGFLFSYGLCGHSTALYASIWRSICAFGHA